MGLFDYLIPWTYLLYIFRTHLNTGRQFSLFKPVVTTVTLVHHSISSKGWQYIQIQPHPGLPLRDMPGANHLTFRSAETNVGIDPGDSVLKFAGSAPGAKGSTWGILAVHTATRNGKGLFLTVHSHCGFLNKQPIIRGQSIHYIALVRPVRHLDPARIHLWKCFFLFRKFGLIYFLAGLDTGLAPDALSDINKCSQLSLGSTPDCRWKGKRRRTNGSYGSQATFNK